MEDSDAGPHLSRPETPVVPKTIIPAVEPTTAAQDSSSPSTGAPPNIMLPVPTLSTNNKTQVSFVYPDNIDDSNLFSPLPSEVVSADISIAPDGSFVETSSGPAARELKRRYDQHHGVGKDVRSPYAITSLINQHGKQIYRVGLRDMSATDPSAADAELELPPPLADSPDQGRSKRRSQIQMSFHDVFKKGSSSRPTTVAPQNHPPRKLRKTRSIPDVRHSNEHVGRGHSQSVTAADMLSMTHNFANDTMPYSATIRSRRGDMFAEVMDWASPLSSSSTGFSTPSLPHLSTEASDEKYPAVIVHPFGAGIVFDSPSKPTASEHLRTPRLLREMQSFESTRTARQLIEPRSERISGVPSLGSSSESDSFDLRRPPSAIRLRESIASSAEGAPAGGSTPSPKVIEPIYPLPETAMHSRYSTDIFDILQTYRGLPQFDMLINTEDTTVKMTLDALDSIAPKDDPRFVMWGELLADRDDVSVSQDSVTDLSSSGHSMSLSKRRSTKSKGKPAPEIPSLQLSSGSRSSRLLIAATIERWIAQLTSVLNYDELLVFFLTYRTYISSVDLCHLLICRFHWSLQTTGSVSDDKNRRVVRTRTFVAFRYWLLTFFTVDFLPSRELRLLVANWLNALIRDPILEKHVDGVNTIKKLIKVVKDCKKAHTRAVPQPKPTSVRSKSASVVKEEKLFGEKFAEATRKLEADDDSDVDLDFVPDEADVSTSSSGTARLSSIHLTSALSPSGPNSIPASSLSILQQTDHAPGPGPEPPTSPYQTSAVLPMHHGLVVRTFVKTMGRIERFKRGLSKRSTQVRTPLTGCTSVSAFELEPSAELTTGHSTEPSVRVIDPPQPLLSPPLVLSPAPLSAPAASLSESAPSPVESPLPSGSTETESAATPVPVEPPPGYSDSVAEPTAPPAPPGLDDEDDEEPEVQNDVIVDVVDLNDDRVSLARTSSTDSFGEPISNAPTFQSPWGFDVVSIDDLDLSDTSSEHDGPSFPPGLRKPTKRLPLRRDFKFAPRPESVSSMGIHTNRDSVVSAASTASSVSVTLGGQIQQWQVNALVDSLTDDGEPGDRDDALRRLEGQINPKKQQEKAIKVDGWVRNIQARMAAGDYTDELSRFPVDDDDDQEDDNDHSESSSPPEIVVAEADVQTGDELFPNPSTPTPPENAPSSLRSADAKPAPEDAVPLEILQSRMPPEVIASPPRPVISSKFANAEPMRAHRSFVIGHRAEVLAQHFAMIDRELFMGVKFEELVLDDWMACEEVNILDWAQYLKDRARWKAESRFPEKTSALAAVRARFNLMATFTVSEVVQTAPNDRPVVFAKFLRIAWKSYCLQSFNTLVAIITALRSDWVTNAMRRHWNRLGLWESRIFTDFKQWCTAEDNFKYIRQTINALIDAKPLEAGSHAAASVVSGGASASETHRSKGGELKAAVNSACVPFIGVYLAQLHHHSRLPDLIDPTAPNAAVTVDPLTGNFDRPSHPEVFSTLAPLPPTMDLEPLINVHKQRLIAGVIKSLVASQHLASRVQFSVDKKLFQKCLRLRGLDAETLSRAFSLSSDTH